MFGHWATKNTPFVAYITVIFVNYVLPKPILEKMEVWDPNYCNDTKLQESAGLTKTALGQFLGYHCDTVFFHCRWGVDGWRTYKKSCRKGLVYDTTGTQNCNYDFNVDGCGMKQCADCLGDQYACCLSEECVDLGMRCDGKYDCTLEEDEQNCPTCGGDQFPCVLSEQCIAIDKRCNGIKDCKDGTDEHHCDECNAGNFYCRNTKMCIEFKYRCNGKRDCNFGEDEAFCVSTPDEQKEYTCEDQVHSVPKQDICNGVDDCPDGSDELYCISSNPDEDSTFSKGSHASIQVAHWPKPNANRTLTGKSPPVEHEQDENTAETEDYEEEYTIPNIPTTPLQMYTTRPPSTSAFNFGPPQRSTVSTVQSSNLVPSGYFTSKMSPIAITTKNPVLANTSLANTSFVTKHIFLHATPVMNKKNTNRPRSLISVTAATTRKDEEYFYDDSVSTG